VLQMIILGGSVVNLAGSNALHSTSNSFNSTLIFISPISGELRVLSTCSEAASNSFSPGSQFEREVPIFLHPSFFSLIRPLVFFLENVRSFSSNFDFSTKGGNESLSLEPSRTSTAMDSSRLPKQAPRLR
jgi:hypothetical protein